MTFILLIFILILLVYAIKLGKRYITQIEQINCRIAEVQQYEEKIWEKLNHTEKNS